MVLPWISDRRSPAVRSGLLSYPYFDFDKEEIVFSYDNRRSNNLKQSVFFNLKNAIPENTLTSNSNQGNEKQVAELRTMIPECYFPSSSVEECMKMNENTSNQRVNKLNFRNNPHAKGYYFSIYPELSKNSIAIDFVNEIELSSTQSALNVYGRQELDFPFVVNRVKSYDGLSFAVLSSQFIKSYHYVNDTFCEAFEYSAPENDYFSSMDISRHELETSSILGNSKKLIIKGLNHTQNFLICDDYFNCSYSVHPSLLVLSGKSDKIELMDRRSAFPGLFVCDRNVPFRSVINHIAHDNDQNLIALSCKIDKLASDNSLLSELRIYDIRYPKESVLRVTPKTPVSEFIYFDSYLNEISDNLIGLDNNFEPFYWEFSHSKSNSLHMDGILSLTDFRKLHQNKSQLNSETTDYQGYSVSRSSISQKKLFVTRLANDGGMDYSLISNSEKDFPNSEPNDIYHNIGETIDFSGIFENKAQKSEIRSVPKGRLENFAPALQSTFHLDYYWDEVKSKICKKNRINKLR